MINEKLIEMYRTQGKLEEIINELDFIFYELIDKSNQEHMIPFNLYEDVKERLKDMANQEIGTGESFNE